MPSDDSYSNVAVDLCFQDGKTGERHLRIVSPGGAIVLVVDGDHGQLYAHGKSLGAKFTIMPDEQWIWSPDSRAVITTISLGAEGPVSSGISFVSDTPKVPDIMDEIRKDFATRHPNDRCRNDINVGGLTWLEGSGRAVLVAEVPSSGLCMENGGYFDAYVVSVPEGRIVAWYPMKEVVKRWHSILGPLLRVDIDALRNK